MDFNRQGQIVEDAPCLSHGHAGTRVNLITVSLRSETERTVVRSSSKTL